MKKFLIFLVSIVVVVSIGLTTYYFLRNDEVISIATKEIYCNAGDVISLDSLGISVKKPHRKTTFDYNAGGESVTSFIEYNADKKYYVVGNQGGEVTLVIGTTNEKFAEFTITVHIGDGSKEYPYNIMDENDFNLVRDNCSQPKYYKLMNDINLSSGFATIGNTTAGNVDFVGHFDGNGHTISGLNIENQNIAKAGLFASVSGSVSNLTIANANINGTFDNVGVLAGEVTGTVKNVAIKNSVVTNNKEGNTGTVAGYTEKALINSTYAEKVVISVGDETNVIANVVAGGFVGKMSETTAQATYTNNVTVNVINQASGKIAGYVGEFIIGNNTGSIQQSYVNSISSASDYAPFISEISTVAGFEASKSNMLRHIVGNIVIVETSVTADTDLIKTFDNTYFKNKANPTASAFFDSTTSQYMVRGFVKVDDIQEYVFYAVNSSEKTLWDDTVWDIKTGILPTLKMGEVAPSGLSIDYLNKNLAQIEISDLSQILGSTTGGNVLLANDIDLSMGWTPVALENFVLDGNNKTITINLNTVADETIALFTTLTNSTVKDLTIKVVGFTTEKATYGAALAGFVDGTNGLNSVIDNVNVIYETEIAPNLTDFGGLVTYLTDSQLKNSTVNGLNISENAKISLRAGGAVADLENATISNFKGEVEINFNQNSFRSFVGGIAASSMSGTITKSEVETKITLINVKELSMIGGIVGHNKCVITESTAKGDGIVFENATGRINLGGIAGRNDATIKNSNNFMTQVGTYKSGYNVYAGGITAINAGVITECVASSDIHGNVVAGIVAEMTDSQASVNEVLVGRFDITNGQISKNTISGDKYLAGVVVNFQNGKIENVQTCSEIKGMANATRSSLIVLIFPYNTTLVNATINNSFSDSCQGTKYAETWSDFAMYTNKAEFGISETNLDGRFNLYKSDASHGKMQSVVLNTDNTSDVIKAMGEGMIWSSEYNNTDESSFVKYVDSSSYASTSTYIGSFTFVVAKGWFGRDITVTKTLNFDLGDGNAWKADAQTGIILTFLKDLV